MNVRVSLGIALALLPAVARAQESALQAEFRLERQHLASACSEFTFKQIAGCGIAVATEHPLHVTFGSIAPQNGMGFGGALVTHHTPNENWRLGWDSDGVVAPGGAWRAGTYFRAIRTAIAPPQPTSGATSARARIVIHPYPVFGGYAQIISLPTLPYYGLGPSTDRLNKTEFGMREAIVGTTANVPVSPAAVARWGLSLLGELNLRMVDIRPATGDVPSIGTGFTEETAPGLSNQPTFIQLGEGVRFAPAFANNHLQLNYRVQSQQFFASSSSNNSFRRWTVDLGHDVPLYRTSMPGATHVTNGPNECATGPTSDTCPAVSHDRWGTVSVRLLISRSIVGQGSTVPFYFQPTLGGSDIDGNRALPSFDDYRFRGPHVLLLQESVEHSVYGPIGLLVGADQGKVALQTESLGFSDLRQSYTVGLTVRAGGFPAVVVSYSAGGGEGHHVAFTINTSLLGGSSRPSLY
jgi:hypothetical protein